MPVTTAAKTPRETDTELAAIWADIHKAQQQLAHSHGSLLRLAGAKFYYRGRQRVTDMTPHEAVAKVTERAAYVAAYKAEHGYTSTETYTDPDTGKTETYEYQGTNWDAFQGAAHEADDYAEALAKLVERETVLADLMEREAAAQAAYTGWSRFFVVTSSAGHVHSSTSCSTCRPTTMYGWLPELSGKDEATAVAELGPTLCTVCFPTAPVDWTAGKKLTAAQAARKAAS